MSLLTRDVDQATNVFLHPSSLHANQSQTHGVLEAPSGRHAFFSAHPLTKSATCFHAEHLVSIPMLHAIVPAENLSAVSATACHEFCDDASLKLLGNT